MKIKAHYRVHFLNYELAATILFACALIYWSEKLGGLVLISHCLGDNRMSYYATLTSLFGTLLGFVITAVSIVLGFAATEKMEVIRGSVHYKTLWEIFVSGIRALGAATLLSLVGMVIDSSGPVNRGLVYVSFFVFMLAILRMMRCVWVLEKLIWLQTIKE